MGAPVRGGFGGTDCRISTLLGIVAVGGELVTILVLGEVSDVAR
jgi:hypothetical protein